MENSRNFREFLELLLSRRVPMGYMLAGSVAELPMQYVITNLTDVDHMNFSLTLCAVSPADQFPEKFHGDVLLVETGNAHPGFARLKYRDGARAYFRRWQLLQSACSGPALKGTFMSLLELISVLSAGERRRFQQPLKQYEITTVDLVACVVCPVWPSVAVEWIRRERRNGWPTKELVSRVVHGGCHFVAKAHPSRPTDDTLFRFSFSAAEIVLVNSWSAVQKHIYHILRLIKTSVEEQCKTRRSESAICSYTVKTLMLWACEDRPPNFWNQSSVTSSVKELVLQLIAWLNEPNCPNYFIPDNNMFEHPTGDVVLTKKILLTFAYDESKIAEMTAKCSMVDPEATFPIAISDKLGLLLQLGVNRISHLVNPVEPNSDDRINPGQLFAGGSEFYQLVSALMANLRDVENRRLHRTESTGDFERTARACFDQSMLATPATNAHHLFYIGRSSLQNLSHFIGRKRPDLLRRCVYSRKEETIIQVAGQPGQTNTKQEVPSCIDMIIGEAVHCFLQGVDKILPKTSYFISAAYQANFHFTHLKQYGDCLKICEEAEKYFSDLNKKIGVGDYYDQACSVVLTRKWSPIFDKCLQTAFGFILLNERCHRKQQKSESNRKSDHLESFVIYISPMAFISYIASQCHRRSACLKTDREILEQHLECFSLLIECLCIDRIVRLTTESHRNLRTSSRAIAIDILNANT